MFYTRPTPRRWDAEEEERRGTKRGRAVVCSGVQSGSGRRATAETLRQNLAGEGEKNGGGRGEARA